jgi:pyridoxine/pyridoxamine 5'-phosphate oxidase
LIESHHSLNEIWEIVQKEFSKAVSLKRHPFKYVALSTSSAGQVHSRYVVLRKYLENNRFLIFTDSRTEKIVDLTTNEACNLLCYHSGKSLQVRVNGNAIIHRNNTITQQYWNGVKNHSAKAYTSVLAPGTIVNNPSEAYDWYEPASSEHFTVVEIVTSTIEVLQLNRDYHIRASFTIGDNSMDAAFLAP